MIKRVWTCFAAALLCVAISGAAHAAMSVGGILQHSPDDITGFTTLTGDSNTASVTLPFTFVVEGTGYTTLVLSTNGWIEFGSNTSGSSDPVNDCLPTSKHTNPFLAAYWDDLQTFGTNIRYGTVGTSPNRVFIADYEVDLTGGSEGSDDLRFQIQLHEGSNLATVRFRDQQSGTNGAAATMGFQGAGGAGATTVQPISCNAKVMDDNRPEEGWSAELGRAGYVTLAAVMQESPDDIGGFTSLTGDNTVATPTIPFNVSLGGVNYTTVAISTNGWLEFGGNTAGDSDPTNDCLPTAAHTNPFFAPYWDDLNPWDTAIRYGTIGTSPNRVFVIDYKVDLTSGSEGSDDLQFQVQIHERSSLINVRYWNKQSAAIGADATIGYQPAGGAAAAAYPLTCNARILDDNDANHEGWSIHPKSNGAISIHSINAFSPDDISVANIPSLLTFSGDDVTANAALGFNVVLDGVSYSTVTLSTNGWAEIGGNTQGSSDPVNDCLPTSKHTNPFIAGFWDDMRTAGSSTIQYGTVGASPNRTFLAYFFLDTKTSGDDGNDDMRMQIQIHEGSNEINVKYAPSQLLANGQTATIGYQAAGGAAALTNAIGCNARVIDDNISDTGWSVAPLPLCGNGITESRGSEQCDAGALNGTAGSCCSATCTFKSNGTACTDDGNTCTNDQCNGSSATCQHPNNTAPCSDGLFCNGSDTCSGGSCSVHAGDPCPGADGDGNCAESCDEAADACSAADPNGSSCSDGLFCNGGDTCTAGVCSGHAGDPCPGADGDGNCAESCDETADNCAAPDPNGSSCTDGLFCNGTDTCSAGACAAHSGDPCPGADGDGNCAESCNEGADNCSAPDPNGSSCTDGLFCNGADTCSGGACAAHTGDPCPGADGDGNCAETCDEGADNCAAADPNGSSCDDGSFCNGTDTCSGGACSSHAGDPCPGPDGDGNCAETCDEGADNCAAADPNGSSCDDGTFCNGADTCSSGACSTHAGDPCPGPNGDTNCAESCDESSDDCSAADPDGTPCRPDAGECDVAETCSGGACPADGFESSGTACGDPSDSACDNPDSCDGSGSCLSNLEPAATACGDPSDTACTDPDTCDGAGTCDSHDEPATTVCRAASVGEACDAVELCDGAGTCPAAGVLAAGTPCRPVAGVCDVQEDCDGVDPNCPADAFEPASTECRAANGDCDVAESCTGSGANCPADVFQPSGQGCGDPTDSDCTNPDTCNGSGSCLANHESGGTACSDDGETCTTDSCDGSGLCTHPAGNAGIECRAAAGGCDLSEQCDGATPSCPADAVQAAGTTCRADAGDCDVEEQCDGSGVNCPADVVEPSGTACGDPSDTTCTHPDTCDGAGACQPNHEAATTVCRAASVGETCDAVELCDGAGACPPDLVEPSSTVCRAAVDVCDAAEHCDGMGTACPADALEPNTTVCRADAGACDVAETCSGSATACPADAFETDGTPCPDGLFCNGVDACQSGVCVAPGSPCSMGETCNEASDGCFLGGCPTAPGVCQTAAKSLLLVKNDANDAKDKLIWKWIKGGAATQADFADPTAGAEYAFCLYDGGALLTAATVPPSATSWSPVGSVGYKYKDASGAADGAQKLILKGTGTAGKSKALIKGKGANLPFAPLVQPFGGPVVAQLRNNATGYCMQGSYSAPIKNSATQYKAKQ
ncbi:MAG: hypothetical protein SF182_23755 [Deltaproteobacteria bacterium]|nr:hypothetical protein [Deltaproteobacteria bacterium]